jgi:peptidoglycan-N-acetylglucosamine deacetylase
MINFSISVIIPALNEEKFLPACLESLFHQDFVGDYEIIVVDNGSEDLTAQVARDKGARVISLKNKGVSFARQAGADNARGDIIVQADADTTYPRWWISRLQKQFKKHPDIVAVAGIFIYHHPPWWAAFEYFLRLFFGYLSDLVLGRPYIISGANLAFYKSAYLRVGGYQHNSYSPDQFNISSRLSRVGKIFYDIKSYGATSERSVAKPVQTIFFEFINHLCRFGKYIIKSKIGSTKDRSKKITSIPTG